MKGEGCIMDGTDRHSAREDRKTDRESAGRGMRSQCVRMQWLSVFGILVCVAPHTVTQDARVKDADL